MLPELNAQMQSRESQVSAFLGIQYWEGPSMGQAEETQNLSTARFPALCTREGTWTAAGWKLSKTGKYCNQEY